MAGRWWQAAWCKATAAGDSERAAGSGQRAALTLFNPIISGSEPVGFGSVLISGGSFARAIAAIDTLEQFVRDLRTRFPENTGGQPDKFSQNRASKLEQPQTAGAASPIETR